MKLNLLKKLLKIKFKKIKYMIFKNFYMNILKKRRLSLMDNK
jgi:hypothetical protein